MLHCILLHVGVLALVSSLSDALSISRFLVPRSSMSVEQQQPLAMPTDRRSVLMQQSIALAGIVLSFRPLPSYAYVRETDQVYYTFAPPPGCDTPSQKPLKTHLDEVTFKNSDTGVQFGITVDPLRIATLRDFGTPEQVAAKVVTAEVNRDGVFDVQLMEDPVAGGGDDAATEYYQLNYRSNGKRGVKRFVAKFYVEKQKLYALTAQCKEENYESVKGDVLRAVDSFEVAKR